MIPDKASCAEEKAAAMPIALRFWQGTSTSPPIGSHTRPSRFPKVMEAAWKHCSGDPPNIYTSAALAIAAALPTSA